jgi:monofunctional biosynthetic peptidoglycan transglycosylase
MRPDEEPTPAPEEDPPPSQANFETPATPPPSVPVEETAPPPFEANQASLAPTEAYEEFTAEPAMDAHETGEPYLETPAPYADDGPVYAEDASPNLFGAPEPAPEIPLPGEDRIDPRRGRDAQVNLDLDLARIKRRKRYGLLLTSFSVLFVALFVAPVTWTLAYLFFDPPSTVLMFERAAEGQSVRHTPVPITRMSPYIVRSVIAAEDANFCTHHGFDVAAIQDAMAANADGGKVRGGSTISQQTAKNLFLWPQRSWVRKGFETYFTALIEFMWPKRRIMEAYLNAAEWGDGIFGVEAAARTRFGVSAADLTPLQAARLAAVLPSPNRWSATSPGPYVRGRAASIVARAQVIRNQHMAGCVLSLDAAPQ